jgi:phosphate transport system substrate-binding protein
MSAQAPGGGNGTTRGGRLRSRLLAARYWVYGAIVLALVLLRVMPGVREQIRARRGVQVQTKNMLVLSGMDLAPVLIPRLAATYRELYPDVQVRIRGGGTRQALEDLFNRRADVAFTSRPMTAAEEAIVRAAGDTALTFPIALGGIAVLASSGAPIDTLQVGDLRAILRGDRPRLLAGLDRGEAHLYAPDPNLGLWTALMEQLGLPDSTGVKVTWLAGDHEVIQAVAEDRNALGFASTLALPEDLARQGVKALPIRADRAAAASRPSEGAVAAGEYPIYHYLYVSCRPDGGPLASGFVSFLSSGRGQRLVEREGFLPAREVPREIQLSRKPYVKVG